MDRPRTGQSLQRWAREQEQRYSFSLLKYLSSYGRINQFPGPIKDWGPEQIEIGYQEARRRLRRTQEPDPMPIEPTTTQNLQQVLDKLVEFVRVRPEDAQEICRAVDDMLDDLGNCDMFGTEKQMDPRGDPRD